MERVNRPNRHLRTLVFASACLHIGLSTCTHAEKGEPSGPLEDGSMLLEVGPEVKSEDFFASESTMEQFDKAIDSLFANFDGSASEATKANDLWALTKRDMLYRTNLTGMGEWSLVPTRNGGNALGVNESLSLWLQDWHMESIVPAQESTLSDNASFCGLSAATSLSRSMSFGSEHVSDRMLHACSQFCADKGFDRDSGEFRCLSWMLQAAPVGFGHCLPGDLCCIIEGNCSDAPRDLACAAPPSASMVSKSNTLHRSVHLGTRTNTSCSTIVTAVSVMNATETANSSEAKFTDRSRNDTVCVSDIDRFVVTGLFWESNSQRSSSDRLSFLQNDCSSPGDKPWDSCSHLHNVTRSLGDHVSGKDRNATVPQVVIPHWVPVPWRDGESSSLDARFKLHLDAKGFSTLIQTTKTAILAVVHAWWCPFSATIMPLVMMLTADFPWLDIRLINVDNRSNDEIINRHSLPGVPVLLMFARGKYLGKPMYIKNYGDILDFLMWTLHAEPISGKNLRSVAAGEGMDLAMHSCVSEFHAAIRDANTKRGVILLQMIRLLTWYSNGNEEGLITFPEARHWNAAVVISVVSVSIIIYDRLAKREVANAANDEDDTDG